MIAKAFRRYALKSLRDRKAFVIIP